MKVGYVRVGPDEQTHARQVKAIRKQGCRRKRIFVDRCRGSVPAAERPQLQEALAMLGQGDTLIIWRLDRLAHSLTDLVAQVGLLKDRGVALLSVSDNLTTKAGSGKQARRMFASLARFEKDLVDERTKPGRTAALCQGRRGGRPVKLSGDKLELAAKLRRQGALPVAEIARIVGVSAPTIYRHVNADGSLRGETRPRPTDPPPEPMQS